MIESDNEVNNKMPWISGERNCKLFIFGRAQKSFSLRTANTWVTWGKFLILCPQQTLLINHCPLSTQSRHLAAKQSVPKAELLALWEYKVSPRACWNCVKGTDIIH